MKRKRILDQKVALVVGGGGKIGRAICESLAEEGCNIAIHDISENKIHPLKKLIETRYNVKSIAIEANLLENAETRTIVPKVIEKFKKIDILVHSAAFVGTTEYSGWAVPFEEQTENAFEAGLRVNLTSAFILSQDFAKHNQKEKKGVIVFISSIYGIVGPDFSLYEGTGMANPAAYGASKAGLIQLTRYLATKLAPDIRVNCISFGGVFRNQDSKFVERYIKKTPQKRMAREEDIKGTIMYLVSDMSDYLTGQNIVLDGGFTIW